MMLLFALPQGSCKTPCKSSRIFSGLAIGLTGFSQASGMSSDPTSPTLEQSSSSVHSPSSLHLPENRRTRDRSPSPMRGYLIPSPLPTRRTRTFSATVRASEGPIYKGVCKCFCRSKGHGFISPADGGPDIFVHISDIEGEYVPVAGDEVTYKVCTIPPKNEKLQAVEVVITHLAPGTKHETWSGHVISS
ncbi:calcium-regulated heat-stable protein 1 isoform X1 [Anser cygnoides]|uniref:calcium-regulated heat-stable protein 1 isoform X1 n=1 Tax=Anser cygnoides TaxID=8845 RepID=UPI002009351E|nr:calcium-regulated heat-stable protein 1 isoform X1 [Anser cygnoides]